jgi:quercetin dioxygenase-like cupin family protein
MTALAHAEWRTHDRARGGYDSPRIYRGQSTRLLKGQLMTRQPVRFALTLFVGLVLGALGRDALNAQQAPPTASKGQTARELASLDLGPEIGVPGWYLRTRLITIEPGGNDAVHSHKDRPALPYVLKGTLTQCTTDGRCQDLREGQVGIAHKDIVHWDQNNGTTQLQFLVLGLFNQPANAASGALIR